MYCLWQLLEMAGEKHKCGIVEIQKNLKKEREIHFVYEPKLGEVKRWEYCLWQVVEDGRSCNVDAAYL